MPTRTLTAIPLRNYPVGETDRIVVLFSREEGLLRAVAKGARKSGSSLGGRTEPLILGNYLVAQGRSLDTIAQAEALHPFAKLRLDLSRLMQGLHLAELTMCALEGSEAHPALFDHLRHALSILNLPESEPESVVLWYELALLDELGYRPELDACVRCGQPPTGDMRYSSTEGGLLCPGCGGGVRISVEAIALLRTLQEDECSIARLTPALPEFAGARALVRAHLGARLERSLNVCSMLAKLG